MPGPKGPNEPQVLRRAVMPPGGDMSTEQPHNHNDSVGFAETKSTSELCDCTNPVCVHNTTDGQRADILQEYLDALPCDPLLMPIGEDKRPVIEDNCKLDSPQGRSYLVDGREAIRKIREDGVDGFCIYAEKPSHNTEKLVFLDRDDPEDWPTTPQTLQALSGSGTGDHLTYTTDGTVERAKGKGAILAHNTVKARNWYILTPGSIHPSGGIYHVIGNPGVSELSADDLPSELTPGPIESSGLSTGTRRTGNSPDWQPLETDEATDEITNAYHIPLQEIRCISSRLDTLLTVRHPPNYPSPSEADQATVWSLLYWAFDEPEIAYILKNERNRIKGGRPKITDEYARRTIRNTAFNKSPVPAELCHSIVQHTRSATGSKRAPVSAAAVGLVAFQLAIVEFPATTQELEQEITVPGNTRAAREQKLRRIMNILRDAGYIQKRKGSNNCDVWHTPDYEQIQRIPQRLS